MTFGDFKMTPWENCVWRLKERVTKIEHSQGKDDNMVLWLYGKKDMPAEALLSVPKFTVLVVKEREL